MSEYCHYRGIEYAITEDGNAALAEAPPEGKSFYKCFTVAEISTKPMTHEIMRHGIDRMLDGWEVAK